jgi:N6-adenosine-specific RNA methylase IME4
VSDGSLILYNAARSALAEAHRVDEVKGIRDKAVAMQAYAKQAKDSTLITQATEIRMRAERRAGELLIEMEDRGERRTHSQRSRGATSESLPPKLSDLGINKTQSSRWQALATLESDQFEARVGKASQTAYHGMVRRFVREAERKARSRVIEHGCTVDDLVALAESGKRFSVILADPPWMFRTYSENGKGRSPERHYDCLPLTEIAALPVAALAASDCALLLWCVMPELPGALEVLKAWGFEYKTAAFVWIKQTKSANGIHTGMGYWTRSNAELCLLATKGSPLRLNADVHQVVLAPVGEHSAKPEEVRKRIERLFAGPYLELYGRNLVSGWTVFGNEIPRTAFVATEGATG